jgi:hypothetical protein
VLADEPDPRGRQFTRIARVDGRSDDILSFPGRDGHECVSTRPVCARSSPRWLLGVSAASPKITRAAGVGSSPSLSRERQHRPTQPAGAGIYEEFQGDVVASTTALVEQSSNPAEWWNLANLLESAV